TPNLANKSEVIEPSVVINSKASEGSSTTITNLEGHSLLNEKVPGYLGPAFEFKTDVDFTEAQMNFTYDPSVVNENFRPEIFYYNEEEQLLERVENQTHDPGKHTVSVTVSHFSSYLLLNGEEWDKMWENQIVPPALDEEGNIKNNMDIVFSIDSSGSMAWMDPNGLRKTATKNFLDLLKEQDRAAVVDFDSYGRIIVNLTNNKEKIRVAIDSIDSVGGTNLYQGVKKAVDELVSKSTDDNLKYVVFLTDGDGYWNDSAIQYAKDHNVVIYTIGLGYGVNQALLERIATETGGKYYFASHASELENSLNETANDAVDHIKDEDEGVGDGIPDYLESEDSPLRNGLGHPILLSPDKVDSDYDTLKDGEEIQIKVKEYGSGKTKVYAYMSSDPTMPDTDEDGIVDNEEKTVSDRIRYNFTAKHSLMFSELSYIDMVDAAESAPEISTLASFNHDFVDAAKDLKDWTLIKGDDDDNSTGFSAIAAKHVDEKHGDMVVIALRGSDEFENEDGDSWGYGCDCTKRFG
ncbi:VWA domain-containing protein, partial [Virgibacillus sp. DJP39]|uniref:vWA domain-containing protein n=1 Tax=Virgibacillus sp. DJP39 TaxID=3409790 RepID=UPI003BB6D12A